MITLRTTTILAVILLALMLTSPMAVLGSESDGKPVATTQSINVNAGDSFELEVPIQAWTDSNHTVTFKVRTRFSFPGSTATTHEMVSSDAILFKVPCSVDEDTPDGDYRMAFEITWKVGDEEKKVFDELEIVVGEGTGDSNCDTAIMVAAPAVLAFSLLIVQRRRYP
ncbi:MAG: hypothetical protein KAQ96_14815 [Thermoplasmata archaeon]|nr:hypothetical protein [Thermoplasmata archaeon]